MEDDIELSATLREGFELDRYAVTVAADGPAALRIAENTPFDAIVLDVMLPGLDGFQITSRLRAHGHATPIVILSARDSVGDIVHGFDLGAADYVTKPFSFLELSARVRSLIRRHAPQAESTLLEIADLQLNTITFDVTRNGRKLALPRSEFLLLEMLMRNAGRVVLRRDLLRTVWGPGIHVDPNNLDVTISSLRARIDKGHNVRLIQTVRGFGYKLEAAP